LLLLAVVAVPIVWAAVVVLAVIGLMRALLGAGLLLKLLYFLGVFILSRLARVVLRVSLALLVPSPFLLQ